MIIKYEKKHDEDVKKLLFELQEYIASIDIEKYNIIFQKDIEKLFIDNLEEVNQNQGIILLAKEEEKIIGLIIGLINNEEKNEYDFKCPKRGRISELIVSKNSRGKETGKKLLHAMEETLKDIGCEDILIEVFGYNELAFNFYKKEGYHTRMLEVTKKVNDSENYICKIATLDEVNEKWDYEISNHPNNNSWKEWKNIFIDGINKNKRISYYGILNGKIITEGTVILSKDEAQNSEGLIDNQTAYLTAFRTVKEYQGKGYFSKLYRFIENDLKIKGFKRLTLGVEPSEIKNMKIYFNWGYDTFIKTAYEEYPQVDKNSQPEKILVNYYSKNIL